MPAENYSLQLFIIMFNSLGKQMDSCLQGYTICCQSNIDIWFVLLHGYLLTFCVIKNEMVTF